MNGRHGVRGTIAAPPPTRFARGWHCLGLADRFREPGPHAVEAFGTKLVVFADSHGRLHVLDAYCRHMGGDLSRGHGQGRPGRLPVPRLALGRRTAGARGSRTPRGCRSPRGPGPGVTLEQNQQLFVWHDPQGNPPPDRRDHPPDRGRVLRRVEQLDLGLDPGRGGELPRGHRQRRGHGALLLHPLRVPDVLQERARGAHRLAVPAHQGAAGHRDGLELRAGGGDHAAVGGLLLRAVVHDRLPVARLPRRDHGKRPDQLPLPGHAQLVPAAVGRDRQEAARACRRSRPTRSPPSSPSSSAWASSRTWRSGRTRPAIDNPLLCAEDGPVYQLRRWYEQFYTDVEDITPYMVERYEFEVDTTRAVAEWETEVAENLAGRPGGAR